MTGDDLKRVQDNFLATAKKILLEEGHLQPVGFVVTLHKHVDKLLESGYGIEFIDRRECLRDAQDDRITMLVVNLAMNWKRLYHAILNVFPQTRDVLPKMLALGEVISVDDAYKRVTRAFLSATELDEKDVISATMRQICDKTDAFASIFHSEAWMRVVEPSETADQIRENAPQGLGQDQKSVEVVISSMETYDFARMITVPIRREPSKTRDGGKVLGFGEQREGGTMTGRLAGFLKPLPEAS